MVLLFHKAEKIIYILCIHFIMGKTTSCNKNIMFSVWCHVSDIQTWINHGFAFKKFSLPCRNWGVNRKLQCNIQAKVCMGESSKTRVSEYRLGDKIQILLCKWHLRWVVVINTSSSVNHNEITLCSKWEDYLEDYS